MNCLVLRQRVVDKRDGSQSVREGGIGRGTLYVQDSGFRPLGVEFRALRVVRLGSETCVARALLRRRHCQAKLRLVSLFAVRDSVYQDDVSAVRTVYGGQRLPIIPEKSKSDRSCRETKLAKSTKPVSSTAASEEEGPQKVEPTRGAQPRGHAAEVGAGSGHMKRGLRRATARMRSTAYKSCGGE